MSVFISICIPAYKRPENLRRLLLSIQKQKFNDFEVVISDDSPDASIENLLSEFNSFPIIYYKNDPSLGTPANWNYAISRATGKWIKLMHDDDWFSDENSLQSFADKTHDGKTFIFSRYNNVFQDGKKEQPALTEPWKKRIIKSPATLLARNVIGPPSVTLIHSSIKEKYDARLKWRVDIDFYMRLLENSGEYSIVNKALINVGISSSQVTNDCINVAEIELPEGLILLQKHGVSSLKNILVYDAWWRILRNVYIRNTEELFVYGSKSQWPKVILSMVRHQSKLPHFLLRMGVISKAAMFFSYLLNQKHLQD